MPSRNLILQEYASKSLMAGHGVNVQKFGVADTPQEAVDIGKRLSKIYMSNFNLNSIPPDSGADNISKVWHLGV